LFLKKSHYICRYDQNPEHIFDIFAFHSLWNGTEVDKIIPKPSARFTLLRDPVDVFESGYVYMGLEKSFHMDINQYAKHIVTNGFPPRRFKCKVK
jgi:hypothetical protein